MCIRTGFNVHVAQGLKHIRRRIASPVVGRLQMIMTCGLTPRKLALTLCIGTALGILPLVWGTSLICFMLAHIFKLNHVALQSLNYLLYPVQLVLLLPFFKLGTWLFPWGPPIPLRLLATMAQHPGSSLSILAWITLKSLAAWMVTVLPLDLLAYWILRTVASRDKTRTSG